MAEGAPVVIDMDAEERVELSNHPDVSADTCMCTPLEIPLFCCLYAFTVDPANKDVQLFCGKYTGTISEPGCYCRNALCVERRRMNVTIKTIDLENTKIIDGRGNPLIVSGIVAYQIVEPRRAALDVDNPDTFVRNQAPPVLKRIVSKFPYESDDPDEKTLRSSPGDINNMLLNNLQERVSQAGVKVHNFQINELSYAPEIAAAMLKKQQAEALLQARRKIVQGACGIAKLVRDDLGSEMTQADRAQLAANLMVVLVSDKDAVPTVSL
mmetsp:Transcript_17000/g.36949  ORF Transcript_17000/g.36949 Transcript_17000/m.36949 type:complete len:268 (-) Transcript_17000:579-1382(-)|eukprot:CAMPEP_0185846510 /NCGR_PEP_ID=MMETSP1354-20130828/2115_1 /TAXON_ID=708628 /ORGANISM="Erythrolobus madagascarensis, Strain CCMP3276" /LENGTH=267 /DNA_ID=CAMNT_0028546649 /DNA_START=107 /DNA_END=910 /DNA_ORIENTATION=+